MSHAENSPAMAGMDEVEPRPHDRPRPDRILNALAVGVAALAVITRLYLLLSTRATEEDFYITLRYAVNLARGAGLVYNPGEHVLGTTTPLYTLFLALCMRLHFDPALAGKLFCVAADAASCWLVWRLGCTLGRPLAGLCAALCLAIAPLNLTESVKGMEASFVACACVGAWTFWARGKSRAAWVCAALVTLLRIDGAVLAAVLLLAWFWRDRKIPWTGLLLFALLILPWFAYAGYAFGSPIPTSLRAKLVVYSWHNTGLFPNVVPFLRVMTHNPLSMFLFAGAMLSIPAALVDLYQNRPRFAFDRDSAWIPMLAWLLIYYGGMAFSKVFLFGWYFLPPTPVYYLLAFLLWGTLAGAAARQLADGPWWNGLIDGRMFGGPEQRDRIMAVTLLCLGALLSLATVPRVAQTLRESQRVETEMRIPIGLWLKAHASPQDTVMLEPIGYIGYYSGLRILDTIGLVSPEVLPEYRQSVASPYHNLWMRFRPEWIVLRTGEWRELQRQEQKLPEMDRLENRYRLTKTWQSPGAPVDAAPAFYIFRKF